MGLTATSGANGDGRAGAAAGTAASGRRVAFWVVALLLLLVQTGFGSYGILVKKFAQSARANPIAFSFVRDACCFPVLMVWARVAEGPLRFPRGGGEWLLFVSLGLTGMFGGQLAYILGIYYASADIASIYQPAMPVWAAFFVILVGVEQVPPVSKLRGWLKMLGILVAAGGALLMALSRSGGKGMINETLGSLCSLANTILFAIYMTIQKKFIFRPTSRFFERWGSQPTYVTAWSYFFGAVFMAVGCMIGYLAHTAFLGFGRGGACLADVDCNPANATSPRYFCHDREQCRMYTDKLQIPTLSIGPLVYAIFVTSAMCYGLITFANKHASTSAVTAFWPVQVLVAVLLSLAVFGETINGQQIGGSVMIIAGLFAVILSTRMEEREAAGSSPDKSNDERPNSSHERQRLLPPKAAHPINE